jgi:hypothetical protein
VSSPKATFSRTWSALSEAHTLLHPFFREHFESKPQSPLKKLFGKSPEDTWAIYTSPDAPQKKLQKELTGPIYQALRKAYCSNLAPEAQQHYDTVTYSNLGSRHLVVTPTNETTTFSDVQWRTLFNFRFSIRIPDLRTRGLCMSCGSVPLTPLNTNAAAEGFTPEVVAEESTIESAEEVAVEELITGVAVAGSIIGVTVASAGSTEV